MYTVFIEHILVLLKPHREIIQLFPFNKPDRKGGGAIFEQP